MLACGKRWSSFREVEGQEIVAVCLTAQLIGLRLDGTACDFIHKRSPRNMRKASRCSILDGKYTNLQSIVAENVLKLVTRTLDRRIQDDIAPSR
jgi:hypothetical protein